MCRNLSYDKEQGRCVLINFGHTQNYVMDVIVEAVKETTKSNFYQDSKHIGILNQWVGGLRATDLSLSLIMKSNSILSHVWIN